MSFSFFSAALWSVLLILFQYFTSQLIKDIPYQTTLYATQKDIADSFSTDKNDILNFMANLLYMGIVVSLP